MCLNNKIKILFVILHEEHKEESFPQFLQQKQKVHKYWTVYNTVWDILYSFQAFRMSERITFPHDLMVSLPLIIPPGKDKEDSLSIFVQFFSKVEFCPH